MKDFDLKLLTEVVDKVTKKAFVPSQQTQEGIAAAQQQGAIPPPPPPAPGSQEQPQIGFNEIAQMLQEGIGTVIQMQEQIGQMLQQALSEIQMMKMSGGQAGKKKSVAERLDQLEQMLAQATGGAMPPQGAEQQQAPPPAEEPSQAPQQ